MVLTFYGANAVSGEVQPDHEVEPINTFGGIKNPTLALQLIILDLTYSFKAANPYPHLTSVASQNLFEQASLASKSWLYISVPLTASFLAGIIARAHFAYGEEQGEQTVGKVAEVEEEELDDGLKTEGAQ